MKAKPGRGSWKDDKPPIIVLVERKKREHYVPSTDAEGETIGRIASSQVKSRHVEPSLAPESARMAFHPILHGPPKPWLRT